MSVPRKDRPSKHQRPDQPPANRDAWLVLAGLVLAVVAYWPVLSAGYVWDDDHYVTENYCLRSAGGLASIWLEPTATPQYYPLVHTSYWIEYQLWGLSPAGYHAVNLALHLTSAALLFLVFKRLAIPAAWLAAILFAVHPVGVESVAWFTERKNVLSTLFYLASLLAYLRFARIGGKQAAAAADRNVCPTDKNLPTTGSDRRWYGLSLALFVAALLSKTVTCSLPAAILLIVWWKHGRIGRRDVLATLPMFVVGAILAAGTIYLERYHVGAAGEDWKLSVIERVLVAGRAVWFYAAKLVCPAKLAFVYPRWNVDASAWWQYLFPLAAAGTVAGLWRWRARFGRGPLAAVLLFVGTLAPALGFVDFYPMRYSFVADHFQYLACPAILALVCGAAAARLEKLKLRPAYIRISSAAVVVGLAVLTWQQTHIYHNGLTLWYDTIQKNPEGWMSYTNLANLLTGRGQVARALPLYKDAIRLDPKQAISHSSYGAALVVAGKPTEAIEELREAVRLDPRDAAAYNNLGMALSANGWYGDAKESFEAAIEINPRAAGPHFNFGNSLLAQEKYTYAEVEFRAALAIDPENLMARTHLAGSLFLQQRADEALVELQRTLRQAPGYPPARQLMAEVKRTVR